MNSRCVFVICFCLSGSFGSRQADTNIDRIHSTHFSRARPAYIAPKLRSSKNYQIYETNDYDDYSGRLAELQPSLHPLYVPKTATLDEEQIPIKVHGPRQDPKLFYQSEAYLKEVNGQHVNQEVVSIYPGRQFIRADEKFRVPKHLLRSHDDSENFSTMKKICIQCPRDRTLIAKVGVDRVIMQSPVLKTCSGRKAPGNVHFVHMYGPKFGSLLEHGSYVVLGRITHNNESLQVCKIQVHVIIQSCPIPKYLISHCDDENKLCTFMCRDKTMDLQGESALYCGENMKWQGFLPTCRVRNRCKPLPPPDNGQISCRGNTASLSIGLVEGSRCRIRCPPGWRWHQKAVTVCRRGTWTNTLKCIPK